MSHIAIHRLERIVLPNLKIVLEIHTEKDGKMRNLLSAEKIEIVIGSQSLTGSKSTTTNLSSKPLYLDITAEASP